MKEPTWAQRQVRPDRLPGHHLLLGAEAEADAAEPGRGRSRDPPRRSRSSAFRSTSRSCCPGVAVDAVFDSVSVATTFKEKLADAGHHLLFVLRSGAGSIPELVRKYLGTVVPYSDNFFATLNSAVFSDGSFAYIPKGVRCPMELSTYFRINAQGHRPVRADADRRRGGRRTSAISKAARRRCATRTSCTPRSSSWWRSTTPRSSTRRCRTGIRATRKARAASTTS